MRLSIIVVAAFSFAASFALSPAAATPESDPPITNPSQLISDVTIANVTEIIREIGGQKVEVHEADGTKSITFMDGNVPYNVGFALCTEAQPEKCVALTLLVLVEKGGYAYDVLNKFNRDTLFLTLFKEEGDKLAVARVELVDGGVTKKNLASAIIWFVAEVRETIAKLEAQLTAGAQAPGTSQGAGHAAKLRPVAATPQELARLTNMLVKRYALTPHLSK